MIDAYNKAISEKINSNMRCIEMYIKRIAEACPGVINSNMRCIEISQTSLPAL